MINNNIDVNRTDTNIIFIRRVVVYCLGLLLLAFGVSFSIKSNLGISPVNSIPYILSLVTYRDQGFITTLVFSSYVVLQTIILGKDFRKINFLQIVFAGIFGYFVSFSNAIFEGIAHPEHYFIQLLFLGISLVFVAIGLLLYLASDIVPQPPEGLVLAISQKYSLVFSRVKVAFDSLVVLIACMISLIFFKEVIGIREGTFISAILIGKLLGILNKYFKSRVVEYLYR